MAGTTLGGTSAPKIFIPTDAKTYSKIVITDDSAVDYTVLDTYGGALADNYMISNATVKRAATSKISDFNFSLTNIGGIFLNKFNGGETVKFYADDTDATTEIFRAKIDNVKYGLSTGSGFTVNIEGRAYPEIVDRTITGTEAAIRSDISIARIFNNYFTDLTLTFWNGTAWAEATLVPATDITEASVTWDVAVPTYPAYLVNTTYQHKKAWTTITGFCKAAGLECYIEYDGSKWVLRTFLSETITNTGSNIAYGVNLVTVGEFGTENTDILNRVIVYGKDEGGNILTVKTENDTASQTNLWIKDNIVTDSSLENMSKVQSRADYELEQGILNPSLGNVSSICLPTLRPGELINVSVPYCNIDGYYKAQTVTHSLGNFCTTKVSLAAELKNASELFIPKLNPDEVTGGSNPQDMSDSFTTFFDETPSYIATFSSTAITEGVLRLDSGDISGNVISSTYTSDQQATQCELRRSINDFTSLDSYQVSNNGGVTWETYDTTEGEEVHDFSLPGNSLKFKINMSRVSSADSSPAYESISLLYK